ncbi:hypothetical protein CL614_02435, partial [archaeon]|nr:hypothetical protein [archaeon]
IKTRNGAEIRFNILPFLMESYINITEKPISSHAMFRIPESIKIKVWHLLGDSSTENDVLFNVTMSDTDAETASSKSNTYETYYVDTYGVRVEHNFFNSDLVEIYIPSEPVKMNVDLETYIIESTTMTTISSGGGGSGGGSS